MPEIDINNMTTAYVIPWSINILSALAIFVIGRWFTLLFIRLLRKVLEKTKLDETLISFTSSILKTIMLLFVVVAALDRVGVDTTSLVALIGAAGLAVGLALQNSLQNFAAGVMLIVFHPFKKGDYIDAGGVSGTVHSINTFTTTLLSPDKREITVPNGSVYNGSITNYSSQPVRRVDMVFGVSYEDDIKKVKEILTKIVEEDERVLKDPEPQIVLGEFADSSINFIVRPWANKEDYWSLKFDTMEKVKLAFDENGITIPYPQMDVYVHKDK